MGFTFDQRLTHGEDHWTIEEILGEPILLRRMAAAVAPRNKSSSIYYQRLGMRAAAIALAVAVEEMEHSARMGAALAEREKK